MSNDYRIKLQKQRSNSLLPAQRVYYSALYEKIKNQIKETDKVLEIGAGAGISSNFLNQTSIISTDFLDWDSKSGVQGNVDAENLPFENNSFDVIFGIDMIHHVNNPYKVLDESIRVGKENGKVILIEPYVSVFSFIIYKLFHEEHTTYSYDFRKIYDPANPQEGDQGVAKAMFRNKKGRNFLKDKNYPIKSIEVDLFHPLSFFSTGGLTNPMRINSKIISFILKTEKLIPSQIMKICASRMMIIIEIAKK